jgi:histidine triad (HIT) family protein
MASVFSKIIAGEIPSYKVFENDLVVAFLDNFPTQPGHTLVVPKIEIDLFVNVPDDYYLEVFRVAKVIAQAQLKAFGCERVCTKIEGFAVPHFHYHLIPCNSPADFESKSQQLPADQMKEVQTKIVTALDELNR